MKGGPAVTSPSRKLHLITKHQKFKKHWRKKPPPKKRFMQIPPPSCRQTPGMKHEARIYLLVSVLGRARGCPDKGENLRGWSEATEAREKKQSWKTHEGSLAKLLVLQPALGASFPEGYGELELRIRRWELLLPACTAPHSYTRAHAAFGAGVRNEGKHTFCFKQLLI